MWGLNNKQTHVMTMRLYVTSNEDPVNITPYLH